jgi:hypothetical protein
MRRLGGDAFWRLDRLLLLQRVRCSLGFVGGRLRSFSRLGLGLIRRLCGCVLRCIHCSTRGLLGGLRRVFGGILRRVHRGCGRGLGLVCRGACAVGCILRAGDAATTPPWQPAVLLQLSFILLVVEQCYEQDAGDSVLALHELQPARTRASRRYAARDYSHPAGLGSARLVPVWSLVLWHLRLAPGFRRPTEPTSTMSSASGVNDLPGIDT